MKLHIFNTLCRIARWGVRFRKRRGYGVHSPFAFGFITGVVYEKGMYYAYKDIEQSYQLCTVHNKQWRLKDYKLLFRMANFQQPKKGCVVGRITDISLKKALSKGCQSCQYEFSDNYDTCNDLYDIIVATEGWESCTEEWLNHLRKGGMLIVKKLGRKQHAAWQLIIKREEAQVTFDLHDFGIVFYRPELQKQHYVVNYW